MPAPRGTRIPLLDPATDITRERCDRCGARALVVTETRASTGRWLRLSWCAHHYRQVERPLLSTPGGPASRVVSDIRTAVRP